MAKCGGRRRGVACAEGQSVLSPPIDAACPEGPRQGWEHIYEREGGRTGVFYMEANLCKSEANLRLAAHGGWAAS